MAYQTSTSIGGILQYCHHHLEVEYRAAAATASTTTASAPIKVGYTTYMSAQYPSISSINVSISIFKASRHISISDLYTKLLFLDQLNVILQTAADAYLVSVYHLNPLIQFQIKEIFDSIMSVITSTSPSDLTSEESPSVPYYLPSVSPKSDPSIFLETSLSELTSEESPTVSDT